MREDALAVLGKYFGDTSTSGCGVVLAGGERDPILPLKRRSLSLSPVGVVVAAACCCFCG